MYTDDQQMALKRVIAKHAESKRDREGNVVGCNTDAVPALFLIGVTGVAVQNQRHMQINADVAERLKLKQIDKEQALKATLYTSVRLSIYVHKKLEIDAQPGTETVYPETTLSCQLNVNYMIGISAHAINCLQDGKIRAAFGTITKLSGNLGYRFSPAPDVTWLGKFQAVTNEPAHELVPVTQLSEPVGKIAYRAGVYEGIDAKTSQEGVFEDHSFSTFTLRCYNDKKKNMPELTPGYIYALTGVKAMKSAQFNGKSCFTISGFFSARVNTDLIAEGKFNAGHFSAVLNTSSTRVETLTTVVDDCEDC